MGAMRIDHRAHVASFRLEAERCGALARVLPHRTPLPQFRRWSVGGVLQHLVGDFRWASHIVTTREWDGKGFSVARSKGDALVRAYDESAAQMAVALDLAAADPGGRCPNFADGDSGLLGWWPRHQAHETLLHRWDLEATTGFHTPIDPWVAADGVDEAFDVYTPRYAGQRLDRPITIACTDAPAAWRLAPTADPGHLTVEATDERDGADLVCGAEELLLAVWKRTPLAQTDARFGAQEDAVRRLFTGPLTA
ncbi:MAG: hypothetical protein RJA49_3112 [Actinomycetota bacterium]